MGSTENSLVLVENHSTLWVPKKTTHSCPCCFFDFYLRANFRLDWKYPIQNNQEIMPLSTLSCPQQPVLLFHVYPSLSFINDGNSEEKANLPSLHPGSRITKSVKSRGIMSNNHGLRWYIFSTPVPLTKESAVQTLAVQNAVFTRHNIWVCLKIGYIPNEIAIFHRDNDLQNHWVQWGTLFSDTPI